MTLNINLKLASVDAPEYREDIIREFEASHQTYTVKAWLLEGFDKSKLPCSDQVHPLLLEDEFGNFSFALYIGNGVFQMRAFPLDRRHGFLKNFTKEEIQKALAEAGIE